MVGGGGGMIGGGGAIGGGVAGSCSAGMAACGCETAAGAPVLSYVGSGCGDYIQETTYRYVGCGAGEFEVVTPKKTNYFFFFAGGVGALLLVVLVLLLMPQPATSTTTTSGLPYDCDAGLANAQRGWSISKKAWCCTHANKGCTTTQAPTPKPPSPVKVCTLWGDPHVIAFDQVGTDKNQASSFYGDGDFWLVKSDTVHIQGRFEGTRYTEGLAATNQIAVGGPFLHGHKIEVGTRDSGVLTVDGQPVMSAFPGSYSGDGFTLSYNGLGHVPDVVPEGNEKRIVHMALPLGVHVRVYQWSNYVEVQVQMSAQPGQDGVCGNFNGNLHDDTTQAIIQRIGARVRPSESLLSGSAKIDFTEQMRKMMEAECPTATRSAAQGSCTRELAELATVPNLVSSCMFDTCFGMNVRARSHAKTYA